MFHQEPTPFSLNKKVFFGPVCNALQQSLAPPHSRICGCIVYATAYRIAKMKRLKLTTTLAQLDILKLQNRPDSICWCAEMLLNPRLKNNIVFIKLFWEVDI